MAETPKASNDREQYLSNTPSPLTPADLDLSALEYMPLEIERMKRSVAWIKAKRQPELGFYMINLWTAAFHQTPAASLPDDDDLLCDYAMCEPRRWAKVKEASMRGFVLCSDGRWYHPFVAEQALEALEKRQRWRSKKRRQRGGQDGGVPGDNKGDTVGDTPEDDTGDRGGETPLRDGTGRDGNIPSSASAPARDDARGRVLAAVEAAFPEIRCDLRSYPSLTGSIGMVDSWLAEGADLERDVLPAVEAECLKLRAKGRPPRGFGWFSDAVAINKTRNSTPLPEGRVHVQQYPAATRAETAERDRREGIAAGIAEVERSRAQGVL